MNNQLESLLALACDQGASHAEVYQVTSKSKPVYFEGNRLKQLESSQSTGTALRVWQDNRPGLAVAYGKIDSQSLVDKAIALSKLNYPEVIELTPPRKATHNLGGTTAEVKKLIEIGQDAIDRLRQKYPELICSAELESEQETTTLINSQGLSCQYSESALSYYLGAELIRGEDFLAIYDGEYTKDKLNPHSIIQQIIQRLDWAQRNVVPLQGNVPVLFTANAATLLWSTVSSALNGKRVKEQSSPWSNQQNKQVISEKINLSQQPNKQPYDCPFDDEGTITQELTLIDRGILDQFYCDRATARELNIASTGNGFRPGLDTYPNPSLINLVINPGNANFSELVSQLNNGIIVDQILGGGADISGDFSVNVDLGYRVENGEITGRIKNTAIAGNIYQVLNQVIALGNDSCWNGSCFTPSLIVDGVSVVG